MARLLIEMAEDVGGQSVVVRRISKQDIAKMIGASREMVSRVMKDLGQQGLIEEGPDGILLRERLNDVSSARPGGVCEHPQAWRRGGDRPA